jgi:hypothetical protein
MTKQEAKELSLEVWRYLEEHPEVDRKTDLPESLLDKVRVCWCYCPLCALFIPGGTHCPDCPLGGNDYSCVTPGRPYSRWVSARKSASSVRKEAAAEIVRLIEAWEVKE